MKELRIFCSLLTIVLVLFCIGYADSKTRVPSVKRNREIEAILNGVSLQDIDGNFGLKVNSIEISEEDKGKKLHVSTVCRLFAKKILVHRKFLFCGFWT